MDALLSKQETIEGAINFKIERRQVCEAAFLVILGLTSPKVASRVPKRWTTAKYKLLEKMLPVDSNNKSLKGTAAWKTLHVNTFIDNIAAVGDDSTMTEKAVYVPFETVNEFYCEYKHWCETVYKMPAREIAKKSTFHAAFKAKRKSVKLVRDKGGFPTCEALKAATNLQKQDDGRRGNK